MVTTSANCNCNANTALDAAHPVQQLGDGTLTALGNSGYRLDWAGGESLGVANEGVYLDLHTTVAATDGPGSVQGLLGSLKGQANDLALPDGTVLAQPVPDATLLSTFAQAWQVEAGTSMLDGAVPLGAATLGLAGAPSFVTATAPGQMLTGSLGGSAPVVIEGTLADLNGAVLANLAPRDVVDVTDAALARSALRYDPSASGGSLTLTGADHDTLLTGWGFSGASAFREAPDGHGGTLIGGRDGYLLGTVS